MNITPLFDRILIEEEDQAKTTSKGLLLSTPSSENVVYAKVLATGQGNERDNGSLSTMLVNIDDRIVCNKFAISHFKINGKEMGIIRQSDVLAIIK